MPTLPRLLLSLLLLLLGLLPDHPLRAADPAPWPEVPPVDFSRINPSDFTDQEVDVPYFLFHFAQVANAVVESGENRGFLDLAVNRDTKDNRPYNARIMEMQMALAYFYGADRPWNPYHRHPAVRARLEAMLERWTRIQNADGLFAEYSPDNYSLAPTNFGAMAAAQSLEILVSTKAPFDPAILAAAKSSLRAALMAMFTRDDMARHARDWSNQFSGSYYAALVYLKFWPDRELDAAFVAAVARACRDDQSPAGFHYEQGGPDFGYSGVHDNNLRIAWPLLRERPELTRPILDADRRWNRWLAYNFVLQPGTDQSPLFITNAGINARTSHSSQTSRPRPLAELIEEARPFANTPEEQRRDLASKRERLASSWGEWPELRVPSPYSYGPGFVYDAWRPLNLWQVSAPDRAAALAKLPWRAATSFNRQLHDDWPLTVTLARRPTYYAAFNSGRLRVPRQNYGLGLVWNDKFGAAVQAVAGTAWASGTRPATPDAKLYEQSTATTRCLVAGGTVTPKVGEQSLREGDLRLTYKLAEAGTKSVTFAATRISTEITHRGDFEELLPLLFPDDAKVEQSASRLQVRRRDGAVFLIEIKSPGGKLTLGPPEPFTGGLSRRSLVIAVPGGTLLYDLSFR